MFSNQNFSPIDETIPFYGSSDSSYSETLDVKNSGSEIKKQWEAIERTLYREDGEEGVADPEIVKECKLWRETFPHFRVRGTKMEVDKGRKKTNGVENEKNVQTKLEAHISLGKILETREKIKSRVVGELVGRLLAKFNLNKEIESDDSCDSDGNFNGGGVQITEIRDEDSQVRKSQGKNDDSTSEKTGKERILPEKCEITESHFERGKCGKTTGGTEKEDGELSRKKIEDRLNEIFDKLENDSSEINRITKSELINGTKCKNSPIGNFDSISKTETNEGKIVSGKFSEGKRQNNRKAERFRADFFSNRIKPFEATKKIDKKYEGLLNRIMERTSTESRGNCRYGCRNDAETFVFRCRKNEPKTRQGSPGKFLREIGKSEFGEFHVKTKNNYKILPGIKKTEPNRWLERGEMHALENLTERPFFAGESQRDSTKRKTVKFIGNFRSSGEIFTRSETDENSMVEFKMDADSIYRRVKNTPGTKSEFFDEGKIDSGRGKLLPPPGNVKKTLKSSSCGDLPNNRSRKNVSRSGGRQFRGIGFDNSSRNDGTIVKSRTKFTNPINGKSNRSNSSNRHSSILPPIETGIICRELTGRPKIGPKITAKRC